MNMYDTGGSTGMNGTDNGGSSGMTGNGTGDMTTMNGGNTGMNETGGMNPESPSDDDANKPKNDAYSGTLTDTLAIFEELMNSPNSTENCHCDPDCEEVTFEPQVCKSTMWPFLRGN